MTTGLKQLQAALAREIKGIKGRSLEGLIDGGEFILADVVHRTPFRTGRLRNSRRLYDNNDPDRPEVIIAFTDPKALKVHETKLRYKVGSWKFLQITVDAGQQVVIERIYEKARIR